MKRVLFACFALFSCGLYAQEEVVVGLKATVGWGSGATSMTMSCSALSSPSSVAVTSGGMAINSRMIPGVTYVVAITATNHGAVGSSGTGAGAVSLSVAVPQGYAARIDGFERYSTSFSLNPTQTSTQQVYARIQAVPIIGDSGLPAGAAISLSTDKVLWKLSLGDLINGRPAGHISFNNLAGTQTLAAMFSSGNLMCDANSSAVNIVYQRDASNNIVYNSSRVPIIRQIIAPQVVLDIVSGSGSSLEVKCYHPFFRGTTAASNGTYSFTGDPFAWYIFTFGANDAVGVSLKVDTRNVTVATPTGNAVVRSRVSTLTRIGSAPAYTYTATGWADSGTTPLITQTRAITATGETITISDNNSAVAFKQTRNFVGGADPILAAGILNEQVGTTSPIKTSYTYFSDATQPSYGMLASLTNDSSTATTSFTYGTGGTIASNTSPFKSTNGQTVTSTVYTQDEFMTLKRPLSVSTKVNGIDVSKATYTYDDGFNANGYVASFPITGHPKLGIFKTIQTDYSSSTASLVTTTRQFAGIAGTVNGSPWSDDFFAGLTYSVKPPNGLQQSFAYQRGTWNGSTFTPTSNGGADDGTASRVVAISGTSAAGSSGVAYTSYAGFPIESIYIVPGRSTMTATIRDTYARIVRVEGYVYSAGTWNLLSWTNFAYNYANEVISRTTSTNTSYSATYSGDRLTTETDDSGISTSYTYDGAGRVQTVTRNGVVTTYAYDAMSRVTQEILTGGGESIATSRTFDDAGRVLTESIPGHGTTSHSYDPTALTHTTTLPNAAQIIEKANLDGTPQSVSGTATVAKFFDYGVETDGREYNIVSLGSATSSRWLKSWTDWLRRDIQSTSPDPSVLNQSASAGSGVVVTTTKNYDTGGRLSSVVGSGKATTYFSYDDLSEVNRSGMDVDGSGGLVLASMDRITDSAQYYEQINGSWWKTSITKSYPTANSATAITTSTLRSRASGFAAGIIADSQQIDIDGNTSTQVTTLDASSATVTVTSTAPGMLNSAVQITKNGLASSVIGFDGSSTSYTYDGLLRLSTVTDPRQNKATYTYILGTTLTATITDAASNRTSYSYDGMGRQQSVTNNINQVVYTDYNSRSQVLHQWGSGTYPVACTYNAFGEKTALTTYRSNAPATWSATSWPASLPVAGDTTQWAYDNATGVLVSKTDAANKSVSFTYNKLGQTATATSARAITRRYSYDSATAELTAVNYDTYTDPVAARGTVSTPSVTYTYNRSGLMGAVTDATGTSTFNYPAATPWRVSSVVLPAFFGSRTFTPVYETSTSTSTGTIAGRVVGFDLAGSSFDLHQQSTISNLGRTTTVNTRTGTGSGVDFALSYNPDGTLAGYGSGNFTYTRTFETLRNLVTQVKGSWAGAAVAQFDYVYNTIGQRRYAQQSGTAFSDYGSATYRAYSYNNRGEIESAAMYNGTAPTLAGTPNAATQIPGRRFEYRFDDIGNRITAGETGSASGGDDEYGTNSLNQYTNKENGNIRILGTVAAGAKVAASSSDAQIVAINVTGNGWGGDLVPRSTTGPSTGTINVYGAVSVGGTTTVSSSTRNWFSPGFLQAFTYDADGNMISDGAKDYFYDAENRLVKVSTTTAAAAAGYPNLVSEFIYDCEGRRVQKRVTTYPAGTIVTTKFVYSGWNLLAEIDGTNGALLRSFTWAGGTLAQISDVIAAKTLLPISDANSNITALVNASSGSTEAVYEYSPSGELLRTEGAYAVANHIRFSSYYQDDETGLVYYGKRYYAPCWGRFVNRDPIEEAGGVNLYGFCGNDGVNHTDYLGQSWLSKLHHWGSRHLSTILGPAAGPINRADGWINHQYNTNPYFRMAVAIVASIYTAGAASELVMGAMTTGSATATTYVIAGTTVSASTAGVVAGAAAGAAGSMVSTAVMGGSVSDVLREGAYGAITGGFSARLHGIGGVGHFLGHAALGGAMAELRGGSFWSGALSSGLTAGIGIADISSNPLLNSLTAAAIGGGISRLTGEDFYNGALQAGLQWALNEEKGKWAPFWGSTSQEEYRIIIGAHFSSTRDIVGHAYVVFEADGGVHSYGFYPEDGFHNIVGTFKNHGGDVVADVDLEYYSLAKDGKQWNIAKAFTVTKDQYYDALKEVSSWRKTTYNAYMRNCTSFAYHVLAKANIHLPGPTWVDTPGDIFEQLGGLKARLHGYGGLK